MRYSDAQLTENSQEFFLEAAGFVIKLVFEPTEQIYFKRRLIEGVDRIWNYGGFLRTGLKRADFKIRFKSTSQIEIVQKERGNRHYYLTSVRDFPDRSITSFYYIGLPVLQMLVKEVFALLLKENGFLLHASGCLDRAGNLKMFLSPSGGGKTTVSDLVSKGKGLVKFSDDILIVRKVKNGWKFLTLPFVEKETPPVKRETKNAEMFFIKKSKKVGKKEIQDSKIVLRLLLKQIWSRTGDIDKETLTNVMVFAETNKFYWLYSVLDGKELRRVIYED